MGYQKKFEKVYEYIQDCMSYNGLENATAEEKLQHFVEQFDAEYCNEWNKKQWPSLIKRIEQYLRGLPSSCSISYDTYDIFLVGQEFGYISEDITTDNLSEIMKDKKASLFINGWWNFIANRIFEMIDYYGIDIPKTCF